MYELPQESPNDLGLRTLGNQEKSEKSLNFIELWRGAQPSPQNENFVITSKNHKKTKIEPFLQCTASHENMGAAF